jgi:riboflavin kinase / FMN adenylyltransferase
VNAADDIDRVPSVVTIGFFDGVHRGHRTIIRRALRAARAAAAAGHPRRSIALTFDRHPLEIVRPTSVPPLLMTHEQRLRTLVACGVDRVLPLTFDEDLASLSPEDFVRETLLGSLAVEHVTVGANFRFGHRAAGDVTTLREFGDALGFDVEPVPLLTLAGETISSTAIRTRLGDGDLSWVARATGRHHTVEGRVERGDARGRELGYPTANIAFDHSLQLPRPGVYAGLVHLPDGRVVPAAASIGVRPQFDGDATTVEAHLVDWEGDLYGDVIGLELRRRLRGEQRFPSVDELVLQMGRDVERTRELLDR